MTRLIEILQELQNHSWSLSLSYLTVKLAVTIRTLQRDIKRINNYLLEISTCKIIKYRDNLIVVGENPENAITNLLAKLCHSFNRSGNKIYQLILTFVYAIQPVSNRKLVELLDLPWTHLQHQFDLCNRLFQANHLNLRCQKQGKLGWLIIGSEQDLQILTANILLNIRHNYSVDWHSYLDTRLLHLLQQVEKMFSNSNLASYYDWEILFFLSVMIKRSKLNQELSNYDCHWQLKQLLGVEKSIQHDCEQLINLVQGHFAIKLSNFSCQYLQGLMFVHYKHHNNYLLRNFIASIKHTINDFVFHKYHLALVAKNFRTLLHSFLHETYFKLLFNFQPSFQISDSKPNPFIIDDTYFYGWEILQIMKLACQQYELNRHFSLFINNYWLRNFNQTYLRENQKNWIIPLYYQEKYHADAKLRRVLIFLKHNYPNITVKSLAVDCNVAQCHFLHQKEAIFLTDTPNSDLSHFKNITSINYRHLNINQQLAGKIDHAIAMIMFDKIRSAILVFDFFLKQKFVSWQSLLRTLTWPLMRKFKINYYDFDLSEAFLNKQFLAAKILLVHKLTPINNYDLPIILVYLKNPLFFHKRNPIHFIFILISNTNNLYQYDWIISYLNLVKNNFNAENLTSKTLLQILNNSLSHKSLVSY